MNRRAALRWLVSTAAAAGLPLRRLLLLAESPGLPEESQATLRALVGVVLPAELGPEGLDAASAGFAHWVRNYQPRAEKYHQLGVRPKLGWMGPSPVGTYRSQLAALEKQARAQGASLAQLSPSGQRAAVEKAMAGVEALPEKPQGDNVVADLMSFFFHGSDALDLCYRAQIHWDQCRGLADSGQAPAPLPRKG